MPLSSGFGKWPQEYGVGEQPERLEDKRCYNCIYKNCFIVRVTFRDALNARI